MHKSVGLLNFREGALVLEIDPEIHRYYFSQLKANVSGRLNKPRYNPHITIFGYKEPRIHQFVSPILKNSIEFQYEHDIRFHDGWYYIHVLDNPLFIELRVSQGLKPNYDSIKGFHITIANNK